MQKSNGRVLYSATDLVAFLECEHLTSLDLLDLESPLPRAPEDEQVALIQQKGHAHEGAYVEQLRARTRHFVDISERRGDIWERIGFTVEAMRAGADIIYQGALASDDFIGYPDFLRRVEEPSALGDYSYEVVDAKLARSSKAKFIVQLAFYSHHLSEVQGVAPKMMHVVLGDLSEVHYRFAEYARYVAHLKRRFEERVKDSTRQTYPDPCDHCGLCKWQHLCNERRAADDHLCQVAGITKTQITKLQAAGITTLNALGTLSESAAVLKISSETLNRICRQARLQLSARETGQRKVELLDLNGQMRGFARLPRPNSGDLFFDMEGDPYEDGGLEYLFGVYFFENDKPQFKAFWAHSRAEEKAAFEAFMDFASSRLKAHSDAHIYHYAHYEPTALKRLMTMHGTRESDLDNFLRRRKLIDLYKVVREGIRVSEPSYSIKNIEHFYLEKRTSEVTNAGASIVYYERWRDTGDAQLLKDIETYNFDDVRSTYELREWLLSLRPGGLDWANHVAVDESKVVKAGELTEAELKLIPYRERLTGLLPADRAAWSDEERMRELTYFLLDFHRRADKPEWWAMFARTEMTDEELIEDPECLGGLRQVGHPVPDKKSLIWTYEYPEQATKLRTGSSVVQASTREPLGSLTLDDEKRTVTVRRGAAKPLPSQLSLGPGGPLPSKIIQGALFRFTDSLLEGSHKYRASEAFLRREMPRLAKHTNGEPIVSQDDLTIDRIADAIARLDGSYLFIQGPPGAGKTYTASHAIVELMSRGFRVGVSSNSHKAINNLLVAVEEVATERKFIFRGAKKSSRGEDETFIKGKYIEDVFDNDDIDTRELQLIAGTAWLFSDALFEQKQDFLFIDEAGQVCLANVIAMGTSAKNIVLLGDQMQLGQPIKGVHPGESGLSSLEYLLQGKATISADRGIFLGTTWRMHPDVCQFISDAVYDGRLHPEPHNSNRVLVLDARASAELRSSGIQFVEAKHDGCSQESQEEADIVRRLVEGLLTQRCRDRDGREHPMELANILVVAPYNMQVNLLRRVLPAGGRIGTVDKFQGQEAEVVIVSMTTSSGDYLSRHMDFLFSKNRLNVAISRARSLAIVIANSDLLSIRCRSPEDMALVNTLCWVRDYATIAANEK
jgi:predicted RecB family nuclease